MGDGLEALPASHGQDDDGDVSGRWVGDRMQIELARKKKLYYAIFYK